MTITERTRKVSIELELPAQFLSDVLTTAVESGHASVWYWASAETLVRSDGTDGFDELSVLKIVGLTIDDNTDPHPVERGVDLDTIHIGISRILSGSVQINDTIRGYVLSGVLGSGEGPDAGDIDSDAADCIVQAGLFAEIVYG